MAVFHGALLGEYRAVGRDAVGFVVSLLVCAPWQDDCHGFHVVGIWGCPARLSALLLAGTTGTMGASCNCAGDKQRNRS